MSEIKTFKIKTTKYSLFLQSLVKLSLVGLLRSIVCWKTWIIVLARSYEDSMGVTSRKPVKPMSDTATATWDSGC